MKQVFNYLSYISTVIPVKFLVKLTGQRLICPFYHTVSNNPPSYVRHLYNIRSIGQFKDDLDFLLKRYVPIDYKNLLHHIQNDIPFARNSFLLSFDDGLREFHDVIAPILLKKGIPSLCFLNSDFIDNQKMFFRFKQSLIYNEVTEKIVSKKKYLNAILKTGLSLSKPKDIFKLSYFETDKIDKLASEIDINFNDYLKNHQPYLTSQQIKSLAKQGFIFGGHSIDHPRFSELLQDNQIIQITESINTVQNITGQKERVFSFPFTDHGISRDLFNKIYNPDYPIVDLTFGCAGLKKDEFKFNIQRIAVESTNHNIEKIINAEYCYYLFKRLLNKNTIIRKNH